MSAHRHARGRDAGRRDRGAPTLQSAPPALTGTRRRSGALRFRKPGAKRPAKAERVAKARQAAPHRKREAGGARGRAAGRAAGRGRDARSRSCPAGADRRAGAAAPPPVTVVAAGAGEAQVPRPHVVGRGGLEAS